MVRITSTSTKRVVPCAAELFDTHRRSLEEFDAAVAVHGKTLEKDLLIKHHLGILYDQLLESNLLKIIQVLLASQTHTNTSWCTIMFCFIA